MMTGQPTNVLQLVLFPPQVIPTRHSVARVRIDGTDYVAIKFDDPTGVKTVLYELEAAKGLADSIKAAALGIQLVAANPT